MPIDSPILVIDTSGLCYASYHTLGALKHEHTATGITFGFLGTILALGSLFKTNRCVFCWDSRYSIRKEWFPDYKKHRHSKEMTEDEKRERAIMFQQREQLHKLVLPTIGFRNSFQQRGYEADDLIARFCLDTEDDVIIVSSDNDLYQLLRPGVRMYSPMGKKMISHKSFEEKHGIAAHRWARVKCLMGCDGDEVPGIDGVGEKTAIKYLKTELKTASKAFQSITSNKGQAIIRRNEPLVTLPLKGTLPLSLVTDDFSIANFVLVCKKYGFQSFGNRIAEWETFFEGRFF